MLGVSWDIWESLEVYCDSWQQSSNHERTLVVLPRVIFLDLVMLMVISSMLCTDISILNFSDIPQWAFVESAAITGWHNAVTFSKKQNKWKSWTLEDISLTWKQYFNIILKFIFQHKETPARQNGNVPDSRPRGPYGVSLWQSTHG